MAVPKTTNEGEIDDLINKVETTWPQYKITKDQLLHPTSHFVIQFYQKVMQSIHELAEHFFDYSDGFFNECIMNCTEEVHIYIHVHYLLNKMNVNYISLIDIYIPSSKRVKIAIKLAINYLAYMNRCIHVGKEIINSNISNVVKNNANYEAELSKTKETIRKLALIYSSDETELLQTKSNYVEKEKEMENYAITLKNDEDEFSKKKCEVDTLEKNVEENKNIITTLDWEKEVLNQKIVWSNEIDNAVTYITELEQQIQEVNTVHTEFLSTLENKRKDVEHIKLLTSILEESNIDDFDFVSEFDEFQKDSSSDTLTNEIQVQKSTLTNVMKSINKLNKKVEQMKKHIDATVMQSDERINSLTLDIQKQRIVQENVIRKSQNHEAQMKSMEKKYDDLDQEIQAFKILNEMVRQHLMTKYCTLQNKITNYFHNLENDYN